MPTPDIPLLDVSRWRTGDGASRAALAAQLDRAMRDSGFFLVHGHGVDPALRDGDRAAARTFFDLPAAAKAPYRTAVGGRGWIARGDEANAYYGEDADPDLADLKETLTFGREHPGGATFATDAGEAFAPNVYPVEVAGLEELTTRWMAAARALYDDLLGLLAAALGLPERYFADRARHSPHTCNINRYPPLTEVGPARTGQYRVAPHTDWGMLTILDRQPGYGGLQVQTRAGTWADAPFVEGAFTVNIADLLARWTGDRWRSTRHRVLAPSADAPAEELISLIMFMEPDLDQVVEPFAPPVGGGAHYAPVRAADYLAQRAQAATVAS